MDHADKILVLCPPSKDDVLGALQERLEREIRGDLELLAFPSDGARAAAWRAAMIRASSHAKRILVVEPSLELDTAGNYRRDLGAAFASLTPEARAKCIACTWNTDGARDSALPGPRGGPLLDIALARDDELDRLNQLLWSDIARPRPITLGNADLVVLSDHAIDEDGIGFQRAVDAFVGFVMARGTKPPIVASIEGGWGAGKSTFLKLVRRQLRARHGGKAQVDRDPKGIRTVWFNLWSSDNEASAFSSFALALIKELEDVNILRRGWLRVKLAARRFDWRSGWKDAARLGGGLLLLLVAVVVVVLGATGRISRLLEAHPGTWADAVTAGLFALLGVNRVGCGSIAAA